MKRRALLLTVLLYVTLDLAWAGLPGAFVFDAAGSIDGIERTRGRPTVDVVAEPRPAALPLPLCPRRTERIERVMLSTAISPAAHAVVSRLARATLDPAPPTEDPY